LQSHSAPESSKSQNAPKQTLKIATGTSEFGTQQPFGLIFKRAEIGTNRTPKNLWSAAKTDPNETLDTN
jgi:hypothetical protein